MSEEHDYPEPISIEAYRQTRHPRPHPTIPPPPRPPVPQVGMSRFIADLIEIAIEAHERRHHGRAS